MYALIFLLVFQPTVATLSPVMYENIAECEQTGRDIIKIDTEKQIGYWSCVHYPRMTKERNR